MSKHAFAVTAVHCASCAMLIDEAVTKVPGVTRSWTSVRSGRTEVELDPTRCSPTQVVHAIAAHGYAVIML